MQYNICASSELLDNSMKAFKVSQTEILVGRTAGRLFACNNSCPHRGASLSKGELKGGNIICYLHGYEFSLFSGRLVYMKSWRKDERWPEQNLEWRKSGNLILYPVIERDKYVFVDIP